MAQLTQLQKIGLAILIGSSLIGTFGTSWSIYSSFAALDVAEFGGIGPVGDWLRNALLFSIGGVLGGVVGIALILYGRRR